MPASFFKKERKTTYSRCDAPIEEERTGQSHCKKCRAEYMREWRNRRQDLFNKAMAVYKQYSGQING